ncbi:MAG: UDP-N-acetylmuramate dehydrogenase [Anaerovoracaceae bacterium]|nr:UDP-N-acetylmuramate dehydrogenase [Anaerovoracaceae bacterium]
MEKIRADLSEKIKKEMQKAEISFEEKVSMSRYTSFKAGGEAAFVAEAANEEQLKRILKITSNLEIPHILIGNGSNVLFKDSGYEGIVIRLSQDFAYVNVTDEGRVVCGAAILLSSLSRELMKKELAGFEFASGIPGSLGGALFMNAGAYGGEMKQVVESVRAISADGSSERIFSNEEMKFGYRHSVLSENGYIAVEAVLNMEKGSGEKIAERMKELSARRNSKQPVNYPSAGSTFKRPEGHFAGKLIEDAGLKGVSVGGAEVSSLHSGFIINKGGATATDILDLITLVRNRVYDESGIMLEPEVRIIG